jgi:hypothetical protein
VLYGPLDCQGEGPLRQSSTGDFKRSDIDQRFVLGVRSSKCGGACSRQNIWITIPKKWLMVGIR